MLRPLEIEMIRAEIDQFNRVKAKAGQSGRIFIEDPTLLKTKKVNEWMDQEYGKPAPNALFGNFWYEGELCIMFADTNLGKSILAVQIGDSITKEYSIPPFANHAPSVTTVLYLDFELGTKQFEARYVSRQWGSHKFADHFYRSEFDPAAMADIIYYKNYNEYIAESISRAVKNVKPKVLIIDNITYISSATGNASHALELMKTLKALKIKYNLSVLVLAHTPKRPGTRPLTVNDLQGSKMLINFADSAFAIGQSQQNPALRYLKQIKQRNSREMYGSNNICLMSMENNLNFLRYKFEGYAREYDHLQHQPDSYTNRPEIVEQVLQLAQSGQSLRQVAAKMRIHFTTVRKILQENKGLE